jgi:hypothetical protein
MYAPQLSDKLVDILRKEGRKEGRKEEEIP